MTQRIFIIWNNLQF